MNSKNKLLIYAIVSVIVCFILFRVTGLCLSALNIKGFVGNFIGELFFAVYGIIALIILKKIDVIKFKVEGLKEGFAAGSIVIVMCVIILLGVAAGMVPVTVSASDVMIYILEMIFIGIAEEVLFRGILQNSVMNYIGYDTVGKIRLGIVISGAVFGIIHLSNAALPGISFSAAMQQAISVIPVGIFFGAVYYRSRKNIWVVIILHAINDFYTFIASGALNGVSQNEALNTKTNSVLGTYIVFGLISIWLMRKKKLEVIQ